MIVSDCYTDTDHCGHHLAPVTAPVKGGECCYEDPRSPGCWKFVQRICVTAPASSLPEPLCTQVAVIVIPHIHICPILHGSLEKQYWRHTPGRGCCWPGDSPRCGVQLPCCRAPWGAGTLLTRDNPAVKWSLDNCLFCPVLRSSDHLQLLSLNLHCR